MILAEKSDRELIQDSLNGDSEAFGKLVHLYQDQVAKTVIRFLGNTPEAEDVGQEVFIKLFRSLDTFRGEASLGTFITRIAINLSLNELKRQQRRKFTSLWKRDEKGVVALPIPDGTMSESEKATQDLVYQALQLLEPKFRAVLVLRMLEGYKSKEVAEILKIPLGTVLSRLSRAQERLKDIITRLETV